MPRVVLVALACVCLPASAGADVFRPAYLELRQRDGDTFDVMWKVPAIGDSMRLEHPRSVSTGYDECHRASRHICPRRLC